jgi:hypothetical protein
MNQQPIISEFSRSNNSFSGVDIKATFGNRTIGELQALSYSITREKAPIYTMGSANPRAFARGKRGIAGTLIFIVFDRHAILEELRELKFQSDRDDLHPGFEGQETGALQFDLTSDSGRTPASPIGGGIAASPAYQTGQQQELAVVGSVFDDQVVAHAWYADQIPGFDITITGANEYGAVMAMKIFGVELLNEGMGVSIDDLVSEMQYTYVAREVMPIQWIKPNDYFINRASS